MIVLKKSNPYFILKFSYSFNFANKNRILLYFILVVFLMFIITLTKYYEQLE